VADTHGVRPLLRGDATVDAVAAAIDGAHLAHIAAHGHVHPRNSLFSSIELDDGPLAVHDLERLFRTPDLVVLSACSVGTATVTAGDELLGLGATFLAHGTQQIVASVMPLPDAATAPLMTAFHQQLRAGRSAADALATAQALVDPDDPAATAAAAGFVCMGADRSLALAEAPVAAMAAAGSVT
jgi:CHAT domain-containing protein